MKRSGPPKRRKPLNRESAKRRSERTERRSVVDAAIKRYGVCLAKPLGGCAGPLVGHEVVKRSQVKDAHLNRKLVIPLCVHHNSWVEDEPLRAQEVGLSLPGWVWRQYGERALAEAAILRSAMWGNRVAPTPSWADRGEQDAS